MDWINKSFSAPENLNEFFAQFQFTKVMDWPEEYDVFDFTEGYDSQRELKFSHGVGRYNEYRPGMYQGELYTDHRDMHIGIDLSGPLGSEIRSFYSGKIVYGGYNPTEWDYGYVLVTLHQLKDYTLFALWGHLSKASIECSPVGKEVAAGEVLGWIGDRHENGGWNPHLHIQLSWLDPETHDMPGVVTKKDLPQALKCFPDPQLVLGDLY